MSDFIERQESKGISEINKFIDGLEEIFADLRERHVDDSVCGLCEYDGAYMGQSGDWCNECPGFDKDDCFKLSDETRKKWIEEIVNAYPDHTADIGKKVEQTAETAQNVSDSDLASRKAAIEAIAKQMPRSYTPDGSHPADEEIFKAQEIYVDCIESIEILPTVQPERIWNSCKTPPKHHKDVLVRGTEAMDNVTIYMVMQWDVDTWRPKNYAPSITWEEWSEI